MMKLNFMEVFSPFSVTGVHLDLRLDFGDFDTGERKMYSLEFKRGESIYDVADGLREFSDMLDRIGAEK